MNAARIRHHPTAERNRRGTPENVLSGTARNRTGPQRKKRPANALEILADMGSLISWFVMMTEIAETR